MKIDCDTCVVRGDACADCVVSFLSVPAGRGFGLRDAVLAAVELDDDQAKAVRAFSRGGLVPPLRHTAAS